MRSCTSSRPLTTFAECLLYPQKDEAQRRRGPCLRPHSTLAPESALGRGCLTWVQTHWYPEGLAGLSGCLFQPRRRRVALWPKPPGKPWPLTHQCLRFPHSTGYWALCWPAGACQPAVGHKGGNTVGGPSPRGAHGGALTGTMLSLLRHTTSPTADPPLGALVVRGAHRDDVVFPETHHIPHTQILPFLPQETARRGRRVTAWAWHNPPRAQFLSWSCSCSGALDPTESPCKAQVGSHCPQKTFPNLLLPLDGAVSPCDALSPIHVLPSLPSRGTAVSELLNLQSKLSGPRPRATSPQLG